MVSEMPEASVLGMSSSAVGSKPFTNKTISIRLDETNYLLWRQHVMFAIESLALTSHLDGTLAIPPQNLSGDSGVRVNPEFICYKQQDSALCSWLLSSISSSILPSLVNCKTAHDIWEKVQSLFFVSSTTKIMYLHCSLKNLKKRDQSMREYLAQVQAICDSLAACGNPLSETMHISTILSGIPVEYEPVVAVITSNQQPYKLEGVCSVLLETEARQQEAATSLSQNISVNMAQMMVQRHNFGNIQNSNYVGDSDQFVCFTPQNSSGSSRATQFRSQGVRPNQFFQEPQPGSRGMVYRGRGGRGNFLGRTRPQCQICGKIGHLANHCYYRFDNSYDGVNAQSVNYCCEDYLDDQGFLTNKETCSNSDAKGQVNFVAEDFVQNFNDVAWFPDSGATTHLTPDAGSYNSTADTSRTGK